MAEIAYTVRCTFSGAEAAEVAAEWVDWLHAGGHIADVVAGGASGGEVVKLDGESLAYEVRYRFPSRAVFDAYEAEHAPRLRAEGLERFPLDRGLAYSRSVGEVIPPAGP